MKPVLAVTAVAVALSTSTAALAAFGPSTDQEPNNSSLTAQGPTQPGVTIGGVLQDDDADYYFFYAKQATELGLSFAAGVLGPEGSVLAQGCSQPSPDECGIAVRLVSNAGREVGPAQDVAYGAGGSVTYSVPGPGRWILEVFASITRGSKRYAIHLQENADITDTPVTSPPERGNLSSSVVPSRDARAPFRFTTSGQLFLAGVDAESPSRCDGSVRVVLTRIGKILARKTAPLRSNCTYRAVVTSRTRQRGKAEIRATYLGNDLIAATRASTRRVRLGSAPR